MAKLDMVVISTRELKSILRRAYNRGAIGCFSNKVDSNTKLADFIGPLGSDMKDQAVEEILENVKE